MFARGTGAPDWAKRPLDRGWVTNQVVFPAVDTWVEARGPVGSMGLLETSTNARTQFVTAWVSIGIAPASIDAVGLTTYILYHYRITAGQLVPSEVTIRPGATTDIGVGLARDTGCVVALPVAPSAELVVRMQQTVEPIISPVRVIIGWAMAPVAIRDIAAAAIGAMPETAPEGLRGP